MINWKRPNCPIYFKMESSVTSSGSGLLLALFAFVSVVFCAGTGAGGASVVVVAPIAVICLRNIYVKIRTFTKFIYMRAPLRCMYDLISLFARFIFNSAQFSHCSRHGNAAHTANIGHDPYTAPITFGWPRYRSRALSAESG